MTMISAEVRRREVCVLRESTSPTNSRESSNSGSRLSLSESQSKSSWAEKKSFDRFFIMNFSILVITLGSNFRIQVKLVIMLDCSCKNLDKMTELFSFSSCIENWLENGDFPQSKKKLFLPLAVFTATHQKQNFHLAEHNQALPEGERRNGVCGRTCTSKLSPKLSLSYTIGVPKSLPVFALVFLSAVFFLFWITIWAIF